jgi:ubiquinone/menaquinone biosynthesis C-methylase UbiE
MAANERPAGGDTAFTGSVAAMYECLLVPLIFRPYAEDMAQRVRALQPARVLELAAGTGVVTRELASQLPESTTIVATDLNPAMLEEAARQPIARAVTWRQADACSLDFASDSFDAVVCQFGAMFFPDRVQAFAESRRVLAPGGTLLFTTWDAIEDNEFADEVTRALSAAFPGAPVRFLARTPHGYHDRARIEADVREAGFSRVQVEVVTAHSVAAGPGLPAIAYCQGTPLRGEIEALGPGTLARATDAATAALAARFGSGAVEGRIQALVVTASD